jgi:hypothetical protein
LLSQFARQRAAAQRRYREFVLQGIGQSSPWEQLQSQILLGPPNVIEQLAPMLQEKHR